MKLRTKRYNNALFHFFKRNSPNNGPLPDQNRSNFHVVQATSTVFGLHADNKKFKAQNEE
jgi:hypothetical protein